MMLQHPIYPLVIATMTLFIVVIQSIQTEKVLKFSMGLAFLDIAISIFSLMIFNNTIKDHEIYQWIYIGFTFYIYLVFLTTFYRLFKSSTLKANHYQLFVKSIKNSKWNAYYVVDKKERIKDMSISLLHEIGLEKEDVIGKKLFNILNQRVRFIKLNGQEVNNRMLESYYQSYKEHAKPGDDEIQELTLLNVDGVQIFLHLVMQPVYALGKYKGRICVGEKKTDYDLLSVEKELNQTSNELESVRHKFIATLEISEEGLFYIDLDERTLWASDSLVKMLDLPKNLMDLTDFRRRIEAEDLKKYLGIVSELTPTKPHYQTSYRVLVQNRYVWFREKGKRLFEDASGSFIMGTINPVKTKHYMSSNIDVLDNLRDHHELMVSMHHFFNESRYFELVVFKLKNIPKINEMHGREVGNMMIAEYIKKMRSTFVSESGDIFRLSGLEFAVTITDTRKMDVLANGIKSNPTFLNLTMQYGSLTVELDVYAGISIGGSDFSQEQELYQAAFQALKIAENPQFENQGCYYKDIA